MTELAALNVKITGDSKDLQTAIAAANGDLAKLVAGAEAAGLKVSKIPFKPAEQSAGRFGQSMRGVTQQLSQVGQQTMATGNFLQALAIQLPDIGLAFGAVGTAAGLFAGIALPMVVNALVGSGGAAKTFDDVLTELNDRLSVSNDLAKIYSSDGLEQLRSKYGEVTAELLRFVEAQRSLRMDEAMQSAADIASQLRDELGNALTSIGEAGRGGVQALAGLTKELGITEQQAMQLKAAYDQLRNAQSFEQQQAALTQIREILGQSTMNATEFYGRILDAEDAMRQLTASAAKQGWLSGMISEAQALGNSLWDAVSAKFALTEQGQLAAMGDDERGSQREQLRSGGQFKSRQAQRANIAGMNAGGVGGGGGGGAVNPIQAELEALQQSLMTQEQLQMESFARQQETLRAALDQRLITQQEYAKMMEQVEATHQHAMLSETNAGISSTLNALGGLFQGSKKIGAAIAVANSWLAFTEVLKDPAYVGRPWARFAAAGSALSAGLNAVRNIKAAQPGGAIGGATSGATGGASSAAAAPSAPQTSNVSLQLVGGDMFSRDQVMKLINAINDATSDGARIILR